MDTIPVMRDETYEELKQLDEKVSEEESHYKQSILKHKLMRRNYQCLCKYDQNEHLEIV